MLITVATLSASALARWKTLTAMSPPTALSIAWIIAAMRWTCASVSVRMRTFAASLAAGLEVDYDDLLERRVMHNLTPAEVGKLSAGGIDVQLHTHRHRTPLDRELFLREVEDNRKSIREMTGKNATHFCYPSGVYDLKFLPWLREAGVVSATTCESGFASRSSNDLLLPRFLDNATLSPIEFESWLTGVSAALPQRRVGVRASAGGIS